ISGMSPMAGATINLVVNGVIIDSFHSLSNGFYYFLAGDNLTSGIDSSIENNSNVLLYLAGESIVGNVVSLTKNTFVMDMIALYIVENTVSIGISAGFMTVLPSTDSISAAKGALTSDDILYSISGSDLILGNASHTDVGLITGSTTFYSTTGNLLPYLGGSVNYIFNGELRLNANSVTIDAGNGNIIFNSSINSIDSVARELTLNAAGMVDLIFVGNSYQLLSLTVNSGDQITLKQAIKTTGSQIYNGAVVLGGSVGLTT